MLYCGIDIGTTNTKAVLLDDEYGLRGRVSIACPEPDKNGTIPSGLWHEHFVKVMEEFKGRNLFGKEHVICSITGQGGSFVLLDKGYKPVSPSYSWTGSAPEAVVDEFERVLGRQHVYRTTGWTPGGWLMATKLKNMNDERGFPDGTRYIATVPESIHAQTGGRFVSDVTHAQITGMFDFNKQEWAGDILHWSGVEAEMLPEVFNGPQIFEEGVCVGGCRFSLATSLHDQYAADAGNRTSVSEYQADHRACGSGLLSGRCWERL